ncbi:hypothetical protein BC827DRAFT_1122891 [Russula dissimulans]|nr:hypothetical protein BC827DRAFT_1122891 [Russula dissimulans]
MLSSLLVLTLAAIAPFARADIYITNPIASTTLAAGQSGTITWQDNNNGSSLATIGPCLVGLYVGSQTQQALLQTIGTAVDVSKNNSLAWTPDASVGPNGQYFIRFQSNGLKDPSNPQYPYQAFSAKFTLTGMTGTFSPAVESVINGASTASGASATPAAASGSTTHTSTASGLSTSTVKGTGAAAAASSTSTAAKKNGAGRMVVPHVLGATGVAAVAFAFFL